jgi:hypothetical protein
MEGNRTKGIKCPAHGPRTRIGLLRLFSEPFAGLTYLESLASGSTDHTDSICKKPTRDLSPHVLSLFVESVVSAGVAMGTRVFFLQQRRGV